MSRNHSKFIFVRSLLLANGLFTANCDLSWINNFRNDAYNPPDDSHGNVGNAFFALRSCHQVMRGKSGEFFSPDYLCSNPPLWCNWTIQVDPGKRVLLHLEDFTQSDACSGKLDQIHLDEPLGVAGGHRILEKCWREAKYTSLSNILHVVQLIRGKPSPPHRGFYGRYEAFVPPVTYHAYGDTTEEDWKLMTEPKPIELEPFPSLGSFTKFLPVKRGEPTEGILLESPTPPAQTNPELVFDYFDQLTSSSVSNELPPWEAEEQMVREGLFKSSPVQREEEVWNRGISEGTEADESHLTMEDWKVGNLSGDVVDRESHLHLTPTPHMVVTRHGTSGRDATRTHTAHLGSDASTRQPPVLNPKSSLRTPSAMRRNVDAQTTDSIPPTELNIVSHTTEVDDQGEDSGNEELLKMTLGESTASSDTHTPTDTQDPFNHLPNMVEPFFDSRRYEEARNHTEVSHLPEDYLFEVAVEVNFLVTPEENWDHLVRSLLISVESLVNEQLEIVHKPKTLSSKRIKRLSAGVLYILWLHIGGGPEGVKIHRTLHLALQELLEMVVSPRDISTQGVIVSVSTADVNECVTQLVLCDINAECVNHFGSYSCRCHSGFKDMSRLGSGGTICVDTKAADTDRHNESKITVDQHSPEQQQRNTGCTSVWSSGMVKGIYVVCFLLSFLILLLLGTVGVLYHRHHRGAFLVHCRSSSHGSVPPIPPPDYKNDGNDNTSIRTNSELPPPLPPIQRPKESCARSKEGWAHPKDCCPSVDLPLLRFSPLLPLDGYMEPGEGVKL
ncbi:uncharacterized protein LOC129838507 isoform X1 [Salvelinus fontinalis]|uniref:uncharacterized protein LOC129838507 isoform X1 n=1 Tax=Salvelinus fontinalis TaxID=8038 RepID=UPI002484DF43|nr:uncharacterized protein LOC129838507 isoform X1 [Salvelinus fontinalis]